MSEVSEALMRRIGKIKALAERGVDGERDAAQAMLENILTRHGLTMGDIEDKPARKWVEVSFVGAHEKKLMFQIVRKVTQARGSLSYKRIPKVRSRVYIELSPVEHVEVEFLFELMKKGLAEEFDKVLSAFIHANRLYGPSAEPSDDDEDDEPEPEQTPEARARLRQIAAMSGMMNPVSVRRAIKG
jgi:hypothetical protein